MKAIQKTLILILAVIAAVVATGLIAGCSMWAWIVAYWITLTAKNLMDYIAGGQKHEDQDKVE
jgi:hypothetical protein